MNIINILWTILGIVAFAEFARLYYRVHILETNLIRLLDAIERVGKVK